MMSSKPRDERERPKRESIINMTKYLKKRIRVKFQGGREASGILRGYDHLLNLVLEDTTEYLRDPEDTSKITEETRNHGITVCRGQAVTVICPEDGHEATENPFIQ